MTNLPTGTVTFLFTDIQGSTKLAQQYPDRWESLRARHHTILQSAMEMFNGYVFQIIGDAFCVAFHTASDGLSAALEAQRKLQNEDWGDTPIKVRMGIHTGEAKTHNNEYHAYLAMSLVQRLMSAGHGGQILLSNATENLLRGQMPNDVTLRDMGEHKFKDVTQPVRVFQVIAANLKSDFPALRALDVFPNNLPNQLTSFIGRKKELDDVKKLLQEGRMLTLIGPGGTGKTRLSIQIAGESLMHYPDGVWLVELAPILDPLLVPRIIAIAVGLREEPQRSAIEMLCDYLREKRLLIILDNCEHLVDTCAQVADKILHAAKSVRILASSREALGIAGEVTYRVPSLGLPDVNHLPPVESLSQYEAVRLFIDRATSADPTFAVTNDSAPALAQICHRLDGIPLAIELAAAKIRVLNAEQIAKRLDDRFRLLTGGSRTALERHQTLRATIDWSYNLLPPSEQTLFRRLSIFVNGWTLEAAEYICSDPSVKSDDVLELLEHLINKSMVSNQGTQHETRYGVLETMRQYANEKLAESGESDGLRDTHLDYFLKLAEEAEPKLHSAEQLIWFSRLESEHDNLRAALEWAKGDDRFEMGLRLGAALYQFWEDRGDWSEGYLHLVSLLKNALQEKTAARAKALVIAGYFAQRCGYVDEMHSLFEEGIQTMRELREEGKRLLGFALSLYANALVDRDLVRARALIEEGIEASRKQGDLLDLAYGFFTAGMISRRMSDFAAARSAQEASMVLYKQMGDMRMYAHLLSNLGWTHHWAGNLQQAKECFDQSMKLARDTGNKLSEANSMPGRGDLARRLGDYEESNTFLQKGLAFFGKMGTAHQGLVNTLNYLGLLELTRGNLREAREYLHTGVVAAKKGNLRFFIRHLFDSLAYLAAVTDPLRAAQLFGAAETLREQLGIQHFPVERDEYQKYIALARSQVDEVSWNAAWEKGKAMSLEQALELALRDEQ